MTTRGGASIQPGRIYHIISRFVAQEWFIQGATERRTYLSLFGRAICETDWRCVSYAVMSNHLHFGFVAGEVKLADWMRQLHSDFASWINERCDRIGGVFVRGPTTVEFQPRAIATLVNYIHQNPVRAGVVGHASESDWTSQRAYLGLDTRPRWLDVGLGVELAAKAGDDLRVAAPRIERSQLDAGRVPRRSRRGRRPRRTAPETLGPCIAGFAGMSSPGELRRAS